jgi:hypothetical protein
VELSSFLEGKTKHTKMARSHGAADPMSLPWIYL